MVGFLIPTGESESQITTNALKNQVIRSAPILVQC